MIKSLLDADADDSGHGSAEESLATQAGSILNLKISENRAESPDPFAITDRDPVTEPRESRPSLIRENPDTSTEFGIKQTEIKPHRTPQYFPPSAAETIRTSGLAWSAGIMFFGSVGLMMVFGWLVDTVLGSSPWGIVGGIVLGSVIGFVQLVRINTQLLKTTSTAPRSLLEQAAAENDKHEVSAVPVAQETNEPNTEAPTPFARESDESTRPL